jgi:hypothetical protein
MWTFAGAFVQVDGTTGRMTSREQFFHCALPFGGKAADLTSSLRAKATSGGRLLDAPIFEGSGTKHTINDFLGDCI